MYGRLYNYFLRLDEGPLWPYKISFSSWVSSSKISLESSLIVICWRLEHETPYRVLHATEHFKPRFQQPHAGSHFFNHAYAIFFLLVSWFFCWFFFWKYWLHSIAGCLPSLSFGILFIYVPHLDLVVYMFL